MARFETCLDEFTWLPSNDGQPYHCTPGDDGGATAWGVTIGTFTDWRREQGEGSTTDADLRAASKVTLTELIRARYWNAVQADSLTNGVDLMIFDFGFTAGIGTSVRVLQEAIGGLTVDGGLGPVTLAAARKADPATLIHELATRQEAYYRSLPTFSRFGGGWTNRTNARLAMALGPSPAPTAAQVSAQAAKPAADHWTSTSGWWGRMCDAVS